MDTYLFISTGNQCGSTLIQHLFGMCENAVTLQSSPAHGSYVVQEGHHSIRSCSASGVIDNHRADLVWTEHLEAVQSDKAHDWEKIRAAWVSQWRGHANFKNMDRVFIEKSAYDVGRVSMLSKEFENSWFVCQVRNPYAVAEGVARRWAGVDVRRAAKHSIKMLQLQQENVETCTNVLSWKYEDLQSKKKIIEDLVNGSIPDINDFSLDKEAPANSIDGYLKREIINLNDRQIANLSSKDIKIMNEEFDPYNKTLLFFGYERIHNAP